jgi:hypothetical protein
MLLEIMVCRIISNCIAQQLLEVGSDAPFSTNLIAAFAQPGDLRYTTLTRAG